MQDGSCNGLQHYAALGRDSVGSLVNIYNLLFLLFEVIFSLIYFSSCKLASLSLKLRQLI